MGSGLSEQFITRFSLPYPGVCGMQREADIYHLIHGNYIFAVNYLYISPSVIRTNWGTWVFGISIFSDNKCSLVRKHTKHLKLSL